MKYATVQTVENLEATGQRLRGYAAACRARAAKIEGNRIYWTPEVFKELRREFTPTPAKSRGLGDTIAKLTTAIGIKPCGKCKERQAALNRIVPYSAG